MKKYLSLLSIPALMTLNSCLQEDIVKNGGQEVTAKLSITLPGNGVQSRTGENQTDPSPYLDKNMRLYIFVYQNDKIVDVIETTNNFNTTPSFTKDIRLVTGQPYKIAAWADFGTGTGEGSQAYYTVYTQDEGDKKAGTVELTDMDTSDNEIDRYGNDTYNDAYYSCIDKTLTTNEPIELTLTRPFGLVQVTTNDWNLETVKEAGLRPNHYSTTIENVPTQLTLLSGEVGNLQKVTFSGDIASEQAQVNIATENVDQKKLSFDYLFAGTSQAELSKFEMEYRQKAEDGSYTDICDYTFTNIPVRRNYITNISGNVLTKQGDVKVTIDQNWTDNINVNVEVAPGDLQSVLNKLAEDQTEDNITITVTSEITASDLSSNTLTMPATTKNITLVTPDIPDGITIKDAEEATPQYTGHFVLKLTDANASVSSAVINLPSSTVTVENGTYPSLTATTAKNTLIVSEGTTITNLTVNDGNVKIYGIVNSISKGTGYSGKIYRCLSSDSKSLKNLLSNTIAFDQLIIDKDANIEGNGETIKYPIEIKSNATISNLIFKPQTLTQDVVTITGENNTVTFDGCEVYQLKTGEKGSPASGIVVSGTKQNVTFNNSYIIMESTFYIQRGLNISEATDATVTLDNTRISTSKEGFPDVYTDEMITEFRKGYDSRGIGFFNNKGVTTLNINNGSVVERAFYAINWAGTSGKVIVNVDGSQLDGRAAFNINTGENEIYVKNNSKLIGRNYFTGPTENFAVIVYGYNCEGSKVSVENSEIISHNSPQVQTNYEYAASLRDQNLELSIKDSKLIEYPIDGVQPRMNYFILDDHPGSNTINISNVTVVGKEGAIALPQEVWDGERKTEPAITDVSDGTNSYKCYKIIEPSDLAWFADKVNSGDEAIKDIDGLFFLRDINLGGHEWTPIGCNGGDLSFKGLVAGNLKTVSNLKIENATSEKAAGLFGVVNGTISQLNIENASIKHVVNGKNGGVGVVAGSIYPSGSIEGVTVKNATIESNRWTGGIAGYVYGSVNNCTVEGISLTATPDQLSGKYDNGDKVGGIVGYSAADKNGTISGNVANDVTIKGYRDLGGIAGASPAAKVTGNSVTNINITVDPKTGNYGEKDHNAGYIIGRILDSNSINESNTVNGNNSIETL